jgi:hypothetical protein
VNEFATGYQKMGGVAVPTSCVKIARSLSNGKTYVCRTFVNSKTPSQKDLPANYLEANLKLNFSDLRKKLVIKSH